MAHAQHHSEVQRSGQAPVPPPPTTPPATPARAGQVVTWNPWIVRGAVLGLALLLVLAFSTRWNRWVGSAGRQWTNDAYLQADVTPIAAQVSGTVTAVPVGDFQRVRAGDTLAEIADADYRARVAQAEGAVAAAKAAIAVLDSQKRTQQTQLDQAQANLKGLEAEAWRTRLERERQGALIDERLAGTPQAYQQAEAAERRAAAALEAGHAQIEQEKARIEGLEAQRRQAEATLAQQEAALTLARINLGYTRITAPADGVLGHRQVRVGQYVAPGTQVVTLVPLPDVWVVANYKETQLTHMRPGQPAAVRVDAFPGTELRGRVVAYAPATGSQFALLPPENATGNFTKIVQRIPVKILLDQPNPLVDRLRPGMSVEATVDTSAPEPTGGAAQ
ncbi:HlyD family secretion protein [Azospirillum soli]|uniref:HlyD family secretion protein n=1 Tax=Azospirillum soli TaxID=1304799 RepID=UPI001B3B8E72|nr:HlyD family secretion protein [Azospirillum soli]MBP2316770.1 membrane fusion protein (multidrug efflux system) [Azospirillum soli]